MHLLGYGSIRLLCRRILPNYLPVANRIRLCKASALKLPKQPCHITAPGTHSVPYQIFRFLVNLLPPLTPRPQDNDIFPRDLPTGLEFPIIGQLNATAYCEQERRMVAEVDKSSFSRN